MIKVLEILEKGKVSDYFGSDESKRPKILARCFADTKEEVVKGAVVEGLPTGCILASGSKVIVADGSRGFLKSDGTWGWETSSGGGGDSSNIFTVYVSANAQMTEGSLVTPAADILRAITEEKIISVVLITSNQKIIGTTIVSDTHIMLDCVIGWQYWNDAEKVELNIVNVQFDAADANPTIIISCKDYILTPLPTVSSTNEGSALMVTEQGKWGIEKPLPSTTGKEGHVLKVSNGKWSPELLTPYVIITNKFDYALGIYASVQLTTSKYPEGGTLTWSSSDTSTITVDNNGRITAVGNTGSSAIITATYTFNNTPYTDSFSVEAGQEI